VAAKCDECDAGFFKCDATSAYAPLYAARLRAMIEQLRKDLQAPDWIALIGVNTRFGNGKNKDMPAIIAAQQQVAQELKHCQYVGTAGAENLGPSHTHFTSLGTLKIGQSFASALLKKEAEK
jgi:lysophospholipase L1-like esterase